MITHGTKEFKTLHEQLLLPITPICIWQYCTYHQCTQLYQKHYHTIKSYTQACTG